MLVKINNIPLNVDTFARDYVDVSEDIIDIMTQHLSVDITVGSAHLISADLNPINTPEHILNVAKHIIEFVF